MRPEIREQRKRDTTQLFRPTLEARRGVGADLQDFYIEFLEFFVVRTEPVYLLGSSTGESKRHERDHGGSAAEARKRNLLIGMRRQREIGRGNSFRYFHFASPFWAKEWFRGQRIQLHAAGGNRNPALLPAVPMRWRLAAWQVRRGKPCADNGFC